MLRCHLTGDTINKSTTDAEEYEEEDTPDKTRFSEHLASIGILGREITEHSLQTLAR